MEPGVLWSSYWRLVLLEALLQLDGLFCEVMLLRLLLQGSLAVEVCREFARLAIDLCNQKAFC